MMAITNVQDLRKIDLFADLNDQALTKLLAIGKYIEVPAGKTVLSESAHGESLFAILSGRVNIAVTLPDSNKQEVIAMVTDGQVLGESALLGKTRRIATATAQDNVRAISWEQRDLLKLFEQDTAIGYRFMMSVARIVYDRLTATNMNLRNAINQLLK
jgi:CRP/FNR family transcriptional regulator